MMERRCLGIASVVAVLAAFVPTASHAQPVSSDQFVHVGYYDVASHFSPSGSGWGGPGFSGGSGDSLVRIVNPTAQHGDLCALIFVFDDVEELQECCACPLSPNKLLTLSTINDLTSNFAVPGGDRVAGTLMVGSVIPQLPNDPTAPLPPGSSLTPLGLECDPSCGANNLPGGAGCNVSINPTSTLRISSVHTETLAQSSPPFTLFTSGVSIEEFQRDTIEPEQQGPPVDVVNLLEGCAILQTGFSGAGICDCGPGVADKQSPLSNRG